MPARIAQDGTPLAGEIIRAVGADQVRVRTTRAAIREFEEALVRVDAQNAELDPRLRRAMREAIESQLVDLRDELAELEAAADQRGAAGSLQPGPDARGRRRQRL